MITIDEWTGDGESFVDWANRVEHGEGETILDALRDAGVSCGTCEFFGYDPLEDMELCDHEEQRGLPISQPHLCAHHNKLRGEE